MLEEIDIEILKFINQNKEVHISEILKKFPENDFSTLFRIEKLEQQEFKNMDSIFSEPIKNSSFILSKYKEDLENLDELGNCETIKLHIYFLTDYGKTFLQNHSFKVKKQKKDFFKQFLLEIMRSIFCPLIVAFLTTLLTLWLKRFLI